VAEAGTEARTPRPPSGITETTFYCWRQKYGVRELSEARRLIRLKEENRRLKRLVANQALSLQALKDLLRSKS
jgi:putative transposase